MSEKLLILAICILLSLTSDSALKSVPHVEPAQGTGSHANTRTKAIYYFVTKQSPPNKMPKSVARVKVGAKQGRILGNLQA